MALPSPEEISAMMAAEAGASIAPAPMSALPSPAEIQAMMDSESPTWGQSARFAGKSITEGIGNTLGLLADINPFDAKNILRLSGAEQAITGQTSPAPSAGITSAITSTFGSPDDENIQGAVPQIARGGLNALAFPGSPLLNVASGVAAETVDVAGGGPLAQLLAAVAVPVGASATKTGATRLGQVLQNTFSATAKKEAAKDIAKTLISETIDPNTAIQRLEAARLADEAVPLITKQQKSYLPQYTRTAEIVGQPGAASIEETLRRSDEGVRAATALQDALREEGRAAVFSQINPNPMSASASGAVIRTGLEANRAVGKESIEKFAERAFQGGEELPAAAAKRVVTGTLNQLTKDGSRRVTGEFSELVDNFRALPSKVDLQTLQNYRSSFGEYANPGIGASTKEKITARVAAQMRKAIDTSIDTAITKGEIPAAQANAWRKMITARSQVGSTFESGAVGDVLERNPFNTGYKMAAQDVPSSVVATKEDALQLIKALKGQSPSIKAVRSSLLSQVWDKSTNKMTGQLNPSTFHNQLKIISEVSNEILTPSQVKALRIIGDNLKSQATVKSQAFAASKGGSVTAEASSAIDMLESAIKETTTSGARQMLKSVPLVGQLADTLISTISNPAQRQAYLNKELARFVMEPRYAEALLKRPDKVTTPILEEFSRQAIRGLSGTVQEIADISEPTELGTRIERTVPVQSEVAPLLRSVVKSDVPIAEETPMPLSPFVSKLEGGQKLKAYNPPDKGSGVTISTGVDLGQHSKKDLESYGLSPELIKKVSPYLEKKDDDAKKFLKENPLTLTKEEADELDDAVHGDILNAVGDKYAAATGAELSDLPEEARAVVESLAINFGKNLDVKIPTIWGKILENDWAEVQRLLRDTEWKQKSLKGRREQEASILGSLLERVV